MVSDDDALQILELLRFHGIQAWVTGGWGIDALLHQVTRPHKDLDLIMLLDDVARFRELLAAQGYQQVELWSENASAVDSSGIDVPTAFVLQDPRGRQIDSHAICFDDAGIGVPAWNNEEGLTFSPEDLQGDGTIAGVRVPCLRPAMQVVCHSGYTLPDFQVRDLELLHQRYEVGTSGARPNSP